MGTGKRRPAGQRTGARRTAAGLARLLPDFGPAREHPAFRRLLVGTVLSGVGNSMTLFAVTLQIWNLTRSSLAVGALGFTFISQAAAGLYGGAIADHVDRRRLALICTFCLAIVSALLTVQAGGRSLWPLFVLVSVQSVIASLSMPARRTFVPALLPAEQLTAGIALQTLAVRAVMLAGPALAGLVAAGWGLRACYAIDTVSFSASLYATYRLPVIKPKRRSQARPSITAGLRYIARNRLLLAAFLTDLDAMLLGLPTALFPALNAAHFGGHPQTLGLLPTAVGVGGMLTAVLSGPTGRYPRHGRGMLAGVIIWGAAIAGFGLARSLPLALVLLAVAGAADTLTVTFRAAMVQAVTPDELRGRVSSVEFVIGAGGPIGSVESGTVAQLAGPVFSAVSGGVGCLLAAIAIAVAYPSFRRYGIAEVPATAEATPAS